MQNLLFVSPTVAILAAGYLVLRKQRQFAMWLLIVGPVLALLVNASLSSANEPVLHSWSFTIYAILNALCMGLGIALGVTSQRTSKSQR